MTELRNQTVPEGRPARRLERDTGMEPGPWPDDDCPDCMAGPGEPCADVHHPADWLEVPATPLPARARKGRRGKR